MHVSTRIHKDNLQQKYKFLKRKFGAGKEGRYITSDYYRALLFSFLLPANVAVL
jgi:hypothetical protein